MSAPDWFKTKCSKLTVDNYRVAKVVALNMDPVVPRHVVLAIANLMSGSNDFSRLAYTELD
jgi:hypothetical protein